MVDFEALVEEGVISPRDLNLFHFCETAEEGWAYVQDFYRTNKDPLFRMGRGEKQPAK